MALVALSVVHADDEHYEKFTMPQPTWYTDAPLEASSGRALLATASCVIRITGTGAPHVLNMHGYVIICKPGAFCIAQLHAAAYC